MLEPGRRCKTYSLCRVNSPRQLVADVLFFVLSEGVEAQYAKHERSNDVNHRNGPV